MNDLPPLAICLVTWNHWADSAEGLASLQAATYPGERQIWVVDNASSDETREAIRRDFPDVLLLENTWNAGFAVAMNQAIGAALAAWPDRDDLLILLLNNDTILATDCLEQLVTGLLSQSAAGIAAPTIYYHSDPERLWYAGGGIDPVACRAWHEGLRTTVKVTGPPHSTGYATGCSLLVRSGVLRKIGMLDEGYFMYWEDADLCARARQAGWDIVYVPDAKLWHKVSTSTGGNLAPKKLLRKLTSGWRFWSRWHTGPLWPLRYLTSAWRDFQKAREAVSP